MKVPPDCSVACWSSETILAPDSAKKLLTAATKPGRSAHRSKSRPTSFVVAIPSTLPSRVHLRRTDFRVSFRPSVGGLLRWKSSPDGGMIHKTRSLHHRESTSYGRGL